MVEKKIVKKDADTEISRPVKKTEEKKEKNDGIIFKPHQKVVVKSELKQHETKRFHVHHEMDHFMMKAEEKKVEHKIEEKKVEQKIEEKKIEHEKADEKKVFGKKEEHKTVEKKSVKKSVKKPKVELPKKSDEIKFLQEIIKNKRNIHPVFRGRFGKRAIRRRSIEKWNKWRKPRGIDLRHEKEDGAWPDTGYRSAHSIRFRHPSGYFEKLIHNSKELQDLSKNKNIIFRISSTVGEKKRRQIINKANELKVRVLN